MHWKGCQHNLSLKKANGNTQACGNQFKVTTAPAIHVWRADDYQCKNYFQVRARNKIATHTLVVRVVLTVFKLSSVALSSPRVEFKSIISTPISESICKNRSIFTFFAESRCSI